jgi:outer membrane lipoprotein SlyB
MKLGIAAICVAGSSLIVLPSVGEAKGCLKGAAIGGVGGHVAGHDAVLGAAAGCAVGHHMAAKKEKEQEKTAAEQGVHLAAFDDDSERRRDVYSDGAAEAEAVTLNAERRRAPCAAAARIAQSPSSRGSQSDSHGM